MAEKTSDEQSPWVVEIASGPEHDLKINDKELKGLEAYLQQMAHDVGINWWELAGALGYIAVGQVAAADHEVDGTEAIMRFMDQTLQMYNVHRQALATGHNEIANSPSRTIN